MPSPMAMAYLERFSSGTLFALSPWDLASPSHLTLFLAEVT